MVRSVSLVDEPVDRGFALPAAVVQKMCIMLRQAVFTEHLPTAKTTGVDEVIGNRLRGSKWMRSDGSQR